VEVNLEIR